MNNTFKNIHVRHTSTLEQLEKRFEEACNKSLLQAQALVKFYRTGDTEAYDLTMASIRGGNVEDDQLINNADL